MGTRITAKGVDAEAYATEMGVPVRTGIRGIFLTNTSKEKVVWNYAPGSAGKGVMISTPTITAQYTEVDGMAGGTPKYIDTAIIEPEAFTIFFAGRLEKLDRPGWPVDPTASLPSDLRSMFVSNYDGGAGARGIGVYASNGDRLAISYGTKDAVGTNLIVTQSLIANFDKWQLASFRFDPVTRTIRCKNHITGVVATATSPEGISRSVSSRTMRIGASTTTAYGGRAKMAAVQLHNVALADSDVDRNAEFIKAYVERKGISFL